MVGGYWKRAAGFIAPMVMAVLFFAPQASALTVGGRPPAPTGAAGASNVPSSYQPVSGQAYDNPGVLNYGSAKFYGSPTATAVPSPVVGMAATHDGDGYWLVTADGQVYAYGDAVSYGEANTLPLNAPIVGIAATPDGDGYWLYAVDGGIFSFGDAHFFGSTGGIHLNQPIVGMAPAHGNTGYWLVASDGGVFAFGSARFSGSMGSTHLNAPVVGMVTSSTGGGYMLAAADGGVFCFGDAKFEGSLGGTPIAGWVDSIAATSTGSGYWMANANGDVYHFGDAPFYGDDLSGSRTPPIAQIVPRQDNEGYWLLEPDAFPTAFSHPATNSAIVNLAATQVQGDPDTGYFCNPYGPCEAWCALFATWVWNHEGVPIPSIPFVGNIWQWAMAHTQVLPATARPSPGDIVLYGTGPQSVDTAVHTGIVAQVWPDGAIDTIEGDSGPAPSGALNVTINGPYLPSDSINYNGFGIFGFAVP